MQQKKKTGAENIRWDLSDLYKGMDDPQYEEDKRTVIREADAFAGSYRGKVASLSPDTFREALDRYADIMERTGKLASYAYLNWTTDTAKPRFGKELQESNERSSEVSAKVVFFLLEWLDFDEEKAKTWIRSNELAFYRHFLETSRLDKPHTLEEKEEKIMSSKSVTGAQAWVRYFDEVLGASRFSLDGEMLTEAEILSKLHDPDREVRRKASGSFTRGLKEMKHALTYVFNTLLADKYTNDRIRNYPHWLRSRNLANEITDESVDALVSSVTNRYDLVHRYYRLKRTLLGLDEMLDYDRYAPLEKSRKLIRWDEAKALVINAYEKFHPEMASVSRRFFDEKWIDAAIVPGKRGGAYSAGTVPSVHPYIFMNYDGQLRDVQTLAHELGHGIHQYLSRGQGMLQMNTPLTTAETASVFGEMLVFQELLADLDNPADKMALLVGKIDDTMATVFRQISMNRFENLIHRARREEGELTTDRFSELWIQTQHALYGDAVTLTEQYHLWWSYIPHFVHTPGYVYAYAFGELLVMALYEEYVSSDDGFNDKYLAMLEKGGSDWPHRLTASLGLDINDKQFWNRGMSAIEKLVSKAENLLPLIPKQNP